MFVTRRSGGNAQRLQIYLSDVMPHHYFWGPNQSNRTGEVGVLPFSPCLCSPVVLPLLSPCLSPSRVSKIVLFHSVFAWGRPLLPAPTISWRPPRIHLRSLMIAVGVYFKKHFFSFHCSADNVQCCTSENSDRKESLKTLLFV